MTKEKKTMTKTDSPKTKPAEKAPRKPRTPDTRPPAVIFKERFNDELRQMERRYANLRRLAAARKAHGTPAQVEAGIKWMEENLADVASKLRESVSQNQTAQPGAKTFSVIPDPDAPATSPA